MNIIFTQVDNFIEESSALYEGYIERLFESENINDMLSASHWYTDAMFCIMTSPRKH
ncbi:MAG: hypothetical protein ACRBB6_05630 [Neptuniibacter sp.]